MAELEAYNSERIYWEWQQITAFLPIIAKYNQFRHKNSC